ncbi:DNA-binding domain-containing protein [Dokdonella sp.]|uniref:HvfC/BufC N-terminal domain-containing protein n=1 Tax=Dokdonella sp. TaxID=2291710 RepID=UPI001B28570F|nr:DNA-binding domain-containing protein [Dokdonella sp.]MBO9661483.1 putative DNA-binding domain-containing protein [Dokdonella sp.]
MSALAELQRELQAHVLRDDPAALRAVVATTGADATQRLGIYAHAYRARLLEVLRGDFPGLLALAGEEDFERLALAYVAATPSPHFNVRWYGDRLAAFARERTPWSARAELAEMAELEWKLGLAFDAADEASVDFPTLAALAPTDWPALRLRPHASLQRALFMRNVDTVRRAVDREEAVPALETFTPPQGWAAWRKDSIVRHRRLDEDEAAALDAVAQGATFADLCAHLCRWHAAEDVAARTATLLRRWVEDGWVAAYDFAVG